MGAIAEAIVAYAQPLLDLSDGDVDDVNKAFAFAQVFWNLALLPEEDRDAAIDEMKSTVDMTDNEFAEFKQRIVLPMIERHYEMFPAMHGRSPQKPNTVSVASTPSKDHPRTGRNAPCPCGSGLKYKRCCGRK